jgi:hypothetical protein
MELKGRATLAQASRHVPSSATRSPGMCDAGRLRRSPTTISQSGTRKKPKNPSGVRSDAPMTIVAQASGGWLERSSRQASVDRCSRARRRGGERHEDIRCGAGPAAGRGGHGRARPESQGYGVGIEHVESLMGSGVSPCGGAWGHIGLARATTVALTTTDAASPPNPHGPPSAARPAQFSAASHARRPRAQRRVAPVSGARSSVAGARPASRGRRRRAVCVSPPRLRPTAASSPRPRAGLGRRCRE